jgi:hypothetical protein
MHVWNWSFISFQPDAFFSEARFLIFQVNMYCTTNLLWCRFNFIEINVSLIICILLSFHLGTLVLFNSIHVMEKGIVAPWMIVAIYTPWFKEVRSSAKQLNTTKQYQCKTCYCTSRVEPENKKRRKCNNFFSASRSSQMHNNQIINTSSMLYYRQWFSLELLPI